MEKQQGGHEAPIFRVRENSDAHRLHLGCCRPLDFVRLALLLLAFC